MDYKKGACLDEMCTSCTTCRSICNCIKLKSPDRSIRIVKKDCLWTLEVASAPEGGVTSFNSRTGDVIPIEGDYNLDQLGDVTITTPQTDDWLQYNGTNWVNSAPSIDWNDITNLPSCFTPCANSTDYIWNQNAAEQPTSNFWISGTGQATRFQANHNFDTGTPDAAYLCTGVLTGTLNGHGFRDQTQFIRPGYAYCNFDAQSDIGLLSNNFDHIVSFQSRNKWQGTGILANMYGGYTEHRSNGGTITNVFSYYAGDVIGAGAVTNNYAFYAAELTKGTNNYAVYTEGSTPSVFGGNVGIGIFNPNVPLPDPTIADPGIGLVIQGNTTNKFPFIRFKYDDTSISATSDGTIVTDQNKMIFWSPPGGNINQYRWYSSGTQLANLSTIGLHLGTSTLATAKLHISASNGTTSSAPIKLTAGTNLAVIENGTMEYNGTHLYFSIGSTRYQLDQQVTSSTAVTSFNGRTGAVVPQLGDYTTSIVAEGTNLYYTDTRARLALSAGTGISYNNGTGVISLNTTYTDGVYHKQGGNSYGVDSTIGTNDNFGVIFHTNGTDRAKIFNNGNVSIGSTTDSGDKFHVTGTFRTTGTTYDIFSDASGAVAVNRISNGNRIYTFATNGDFSGRFDVYSGSNTVASRISGGTTDSYINGGGNFAVGTTNANGFKVYVSGNQALTEYLITSRSGAFSNGVYLNGTGNFGTLQTTNTNIWSLGYDSTHGLARLGTAVLSWNSSGRVLIGTTTDTGYTLNVNGTGRFADSLKTTGIELALSTKTTSYTAVKTDHVLLCNATSGAITVTLPTTGVGTGQEFVIKKIDASANAVTIDPNSTATIDGAATLPITTQYRAIRCVFDGSNYWTI